MKISKDKNLVYFEDFLKKKNCYILDKDRNVIPASLMELSTYLEESTEERIVKRDTVNGLRVSTVFIGLDHNFSMPEEREKEDYKPYIFETMIFDVDEKEIYCDRYATWAEAEEGHQKAIKLVKYGCKEID